MGSFASSGFVGNRRRHIFSTMGVSFIQENYSLSTRRKGGSLRGLAVLSLGTLGSRAAANLVAHKPAGHEPRMNPNRILVKNNSPVYSQAGQQLHREQRSIRPLAEKPK